MVIASDPELQKMAKRELEEKIMASEAGRSKFRSKVQAYESQKNASGGARKVPQPSTRQSVSARQAGMSESRRLNGYIRPCCYWAEVHGSKPARGQLSSINRCGKKVLGVLMKTPGPDPTNAYESWSVGQDIVERSAEIAKSDDTAPEEMDRRQEAALRRVRGVVRDKGTTARSSSAPASRASSATTTATTTCSTLSSTGRRGQSASWIACSAAETTRVRQSRRGPG